MSPVRMSRIESALRVVLAFQKTRSGHDLAGMMKLVSDECVFESAQPAPDGDVYHGKEAIAQYWQNFFRGAPQIRIKTEDVFGLGDRCILRWQYEWADADRKEDHIRGVDIFQVKDEAIIEIFSYLKSA